MGEAVLRFGRVRTGQRGSFVDPRVEGPPRTRDRSAPVNAGHAVQIGASAFNALGSVNVPPQLGGFTVSIPLTCPSVNDEVVHDVTLTTPTFGA